MSTQILNFSGAGAETEQAVEQLVHQIMKLVVGKRVAIGLDALASAYITTVSNVNHPDCTKTSIAMLRKVADLMEAGQFDQSSRAGAGNNQVH